MLNLYHTLVTQKGYEALRGAPILPHYLGSRFGAAQPPRKLV